MDRNDYYNNEQEEWRRRREREQWGGWGQGGYGQGGGPGQEFGQSSAGNYGYQSGGGGYGRGRYEGYGEGEYGGRYGGGFGGSGFRQGGGGSYGGSPYREEDFGGGYDLGRGMRYTTIVVGRFYGRGPKGYQRADDRIREDVSEELYRHPEIAADEIEVQVENGEVTLSGKVEDRRQKRLAEDVAERCSGVRDVHNRLKVDQGFFAKLFGGGDEGERERGRGDR